jgi:hypothetical protein
MFRLNVGTARRVLARFITVAAIVALTVLTMRLVGPAVTVAQPAEHDEVRARAFVLVGADGTMLGRLAPGGAGNGNLTLYDTAGRQRIWMAGAGNVVIFDSDGKVQGSFSGGLGAGLYLFDGNSNARVVLGFNPATNAGGLGIYDANTKPRIRMGSFDGEVFGLGVLDAEGAITHTAYPVPRP